MLTAAVAPAVLPSHGELDTSCRAIPGIYMVVPLPFLLACTEIPFPECRRQLFGK